MTGAIVGVLLLTVNRRSLNLVGLRDDAAIIPAGYPALEGVTSPFYPTRCKEKGSKRTFNDITGTLLDGSKSSVRHWILAMFLLCLVCSSRRIARELGVHIRTGYRWCWWRRNAALSYEMESRLEGTVEADDLYLTGQNINPDPFLIDIEQPLTRRRSSWIAGSYPTILPKNLNSF